MTEFPAELQRCIDKGLIKPDRPELEHLRQGVCGKCGEAPGTVRRQNTAYNDEILNWVIACDPCFEEIQDYWKERWTEYYGGLL